MHVTRRLRAGAAVVLLSCAATTAVAGASVPPAKPVPPAAPSVLRLVAAQTSKPSTMHLVATVEVTTRSNAKTVHGAVTVNGDVDRLAKASRMDMDLGSFVRKIADASNQPMPAALKDPAVLRMRVVSIGSKVWMSFPLVGAMSGKPSPKPWVVLDVADLGVTAADVARSQGADPTQGLDMLRGFAGDVTMVGNETIDGVDTTRYRATIGLDALLANVPSARAAETKALFGKAVSIPAEVWVDADGRARRLDLTFGLDSAQAGASVKASYRFSRFGESVSITPPPSSEVSAATDDPALAALIRRAASSKAS